MNMTTTDKRIIKNQSAKTMYYMVQQEKQSARENSVKDAEIMLHKEFFRQ